MQYVATIVDDSSERLQTAVSAQRELPGYAMDAYFYRSHVAYSKELSQIVFRSWLYAGHVSQVQSPGDYFQYQIGEDAVIVCRAGPDDDQIHAFMNVCRHRGARVCESESGSTKTFVCPYHGWVYNLDGSLRAAREMGALEGFEPDNFGLRRVRLEVFEGLLFINLDEHAESFTPELENVASPLRAHDFAHARVAHQKTYRIEANWKLCLENYLECYHCATSHRHYAKAHSLKEPQAKVADLNAAMLARAEAATGVAGVGQDYRALYASAKSFGACVSHWRYALYEGYQTGSPDGRPVAPLMGDYKGYDGGTGDYQFGPLSFMLAYPDYAVVYRFTPRELTATDMEVVWLVNGSAKESVDYELDALTWLWHETTLEDEHIILRNSAGVNSHFFQPGPYHPEFEDLCMDFVEWYLQAVLSESS